MMEGWCLLGGLEHASGLEVMENLHEQIFGVLSILVRLLQGLWFAYLVRQQQLRRISLHLLDVVN
jgi:hypothetical protein